MAEQDIPPPTITAMKIPIIRKGEYDIWSMRMRQYICHTDHNLWDVIVNGDLEEEPAPTGDQSGPSAPPAPKTAKQLAARRNQKRVKSILLLAIPDEYLLKFHNFENFSTASNESLDKAYDRFQKLISQLEVHGAPISKEDINQKFLRSPPSSWNQIALIMRNKPDIDKTDIGDLYNNLRVYEDELKRSSGSNSASQNLAFLSFENTSSTNEVSTASGDFGSQLKKRFSVMEEMTWRNFIFDWQLAKLLQRFEWLQLSRKGQLCKNAASEGYQERRCYGDNGRSNAPTNESSSHALVAQDGLGGYDWSNDFEVEPVNYALMAISSLILSSSSDSEKVVKERDELKDKIAKWEESTKNLDEILNSQMSARDKTGLGYSTQLNELSSNHETDSENSLSIFDVRSSDEENTPENDRFSKNRNKIIESQTTEINTKTSETACQTNAKKPKSASESVVSNPKINRNRVITEDWNSISRKKSMKCKQLDLRLKQPSVSTARPVCTAKSSVSTARPVCTARPSVSNAMPVCTSRSSVSTARPVCTARPSVSTARPVCIARPSVSTARPVCTGRPSVSTARPVCTGRPSVSTARPVYATRLIYPRMNNEPKGNYWITVLKTWNIHAQEGWSNLEILLQDYAVVDSGYSSHMTGNKAYHSDYEDFNRGFVLFEKSINKKRCDNVKIIRCDNGIEFKNHGMNEFCAKKGIKMEFSVARTLQQNGVTERKNKTLIEAARTIKELLGTVLLDFDLDFPHQFNELYSLGSSGKDKGPTQEYILLPLQPHRTRIPVEDVPPAAHEKPSESSPKDNDVQDSEDAANKESEQDLQDELEKMVTQELAAKAMDDVHLLVLIGKIPIDASTLPNADLPIDPNMPDLEDASDTLPNDGIFNGAYDDDEDVGAVADFNNMDNTIAVSPIPTLRIHKDHPKGQILGDPTSAVQTRGKIQKASSAQQALVSYIHKQNRTNHKDHQNCLFACFLSQEEPKTISQALQDESWVEAMQEELLQFKLQKVWVLVDLPYGKKVIGTKWVFRNKRDERSIVVKNKARLVVQGFRQEEGIDYDEVFAPITRIKAIRLFLAFASYMGFTVYQMDVKSAFLYGTIEEEVYVHQPLGFVDPAHPNKVYKVIKALYGLHQAPRAWYETLSSFLMENGFRRGTIDKTLFIKKKKSDIMLVQVYVDNIIFGSTKQSMCIEFEDCMHKKFQMSSMGELTFFLGLQVKQLPKGIFISQDKSMIGSLMYLTASRPDIMFTVCACARFQVTPKASHLNTVKRIFRYLKHQPKLGLWYPRDSPFELEAYSDGDYGGASLNRKSTIGRCQFLGRRLISWQCMK
ncbi:putative ribonuclease H-like domain-containing protein [Tanacetum coccineum]